MRAWLFIWAWVLVACAAACGGGSVVNGDGGDNGDGGTSGDVDNPLTGGKLTSITVDPPNATITIVNDVVVTQKFKAVGHYADNSQKDLLTDVMWFATNPQIGKIDGSGLYTPTTDIGGTVGIRAESMGQKATAQLTVKLQYLRNSAMLGATEQNALRNASTFDGSVVWAYPYDKTSFPRGLGAPPLEWNNGLAPDVYRIHVESPTYELEDFAKVPPPSRYIWATADWTKFVDSTTGGSKLDVERWNGAQASVLVKHTWTIAPASMRGTVYYWANNTGRIMRLKGNAKTPDDFSAGKVPNGA